MKRCRGQFQCEKQANKEVQRLLKRKPDYLDEEIEDLDMLPKNTDKPITLEQMKRKGHMRF